VLGRAEHQPALAPGVHPVLDQQPGQHGGDRHHALTGGALGGHLALDLVRTGTRPPKAELREERDQAIRYAYQAGLLMQDIGKVVGLTHQRVSDIIRRKP
jgi:hypothetical protein